MRIPFISLIAGGALALGGCAYGGLGLGLGYGGGYGYGYGSPYYGGYGYGSAITAATATAVRLRRLWLRLAYYGWYDNYYYPGTGYYVYDSYRRPHAMTTTQRHYWTRAQPRIATTSGARRPRASPNWSGFNRRQTAAAERSRRGAGSPQHAPTRRQTKRRQARAAAGSGRSR